MSANFRQISEEFYKAAAAASDPDSRITRARLAYEVARKAEAVERWRGLAGGSVNSAGFRPAAAQRYRLRTQEEILP